MSLSERLREVLRSSNAGLPRVGPPTGSLNPGLGPATADLADVLGGAWQDGPARCFVVERRTSPTARHGSVRIQEMAERLDACAPQAAILTPGPPVRAPFLFFDLETTGLSGGAGTYAFLVGCGWFEGDGSFLTRQYLLASFGDERALLQAVAADIGRAGALVSFNGKSFDAPVLETRHLFHRLPWSAGALPHLDVLHPARRFWSRDDRRRPPAPDLGGERGLDAWREAGAEASSEGCSLGVLERQVLGVHRGADVPGFEIPSRYFQFIRSGDARPLQAVLAHNRLDLLSLAGLTARLVHLVSAGPDAARDAREALALGRLYAGARLASRARDAFASAIAAAEGEGEAPPSAARAAGGTVMAEALHGLAIAERRARRFDEAARHWRRLLSVPGCPSRLAREASEALAIHHEHRVPDLGVAKAFALRSLGREAAGSWNEAVRYRLARLERKLAVAPLWPQSAEEGE